MEACTQSNSAPRRICRVFGGRCDWHPKRERSIRLSPNLLFCFIYLFVCANLANINFRKVSSGRLRPESFIYTQNILLSMFPFRFLSVKKWLLRKKHQIELARKRGWKGYWVCLKGTTLLFYPCDSREGRSVESAPKHLIIVDGAIMQPIPEHPKRDYIFCLSTAFGDAYLFQAPCQVSLVYYQSANECVAARGNTDNEIKYLILSRQQKVELENWVNSIHSACAAAFARHRGKTGTLHLLQEEIFRLEKAIESVSDSHSV